MGVQDGCLVDVDAAVGQKALGVVQEEGGGEEAADGPALLEDRVLLFLENPGLKPGNTDFR